MSKDSAKKSSSMKSKMSLHLKKPKAATNIDKFSYSKSQVLSYDPSDALVGVSKLEASDEPAASV